MTEEKFQEITQKGFNVSLIKYMRIVMFLTLIKDAF